MVRKCVLFCAEEIQEEEEEEAILCKPCAVMEPTNIASIYVRIERRFKV